MAAIVLVIAACSSSDDEASAATTMPPPGPSTTTATTESPTAGAAPVTDAAPTTVTVPALTVDEALAVSDAYIEAFNNGDTDAVLALFTSDVALSEKYTGMTASFEAIDRAFFEQHLAWSTTQGTTFTSPECAVTEEGTGAAVTVLCEFGWLYAAERAVDAPPVPTVLTMVVTADGISQAAFEYPPEFGLAAFDRWLYANQSDDLEGVEYGDWDSVSEAEQGGTLRAQYVEEWAASLEADDSDPAAVLADYLEVWNTEDAEAVMVFYAEDAVVENHPTVGGVLATGKSEILVIEARLDAAQGSTGTMEYLNMEVSGDTVTFDNIFYNGSGECFSSAGSEATIENDLITLIVWGDTDADLC